MLRANVEYISSHGYKYQTDSLGRIQSASGKLTKGQAKRNQYAQSNVGGVDRKGDDHGGHLIASIFNGSGDIDNLVPMNGKLNQGAYRSIENQWKKALDASPPKKVEVNIRPVYEGNSNRPVEFEIEYKIDNEKFDAVLPNY